MKQTIKAKYEELSREVTRYKTALFGVRSVVSLELPAYGKVGEPNEPGKAQPNVVFVKDLISQIMTAKTLGYETYLQSDGGTLTVYLVEKKPPLPMTLQYLQ